MKLIFSLKKIKNSLLFLIVYGIFVANAHAFSSTYPTMSITGDHNDWSPGTTSMTLIDTNTWEILIDLDENDKFKFTPHSNWTLSFGENGGGSNIEVNDGTGTYRITFYDNSKNYKVEKYTAAQGKQRVYFKNTSFNAPHAHIWNAQPSTVFVDTSWPGVAMVNEGNGYYRYDFDGSEITSSSIIFNDSGNNKTNTLSYNSNLNCYQDSTWVSANDCGFIDPNQAITAKISHTITNPWLGSTHTISGGSSISGGGNIQSYLWSTGETSESINITLDQLGETSLSLTVTNTANETDTTSLSLQVIDKPETIELWVEAASAPTIWAWSADTSISEEMGFSWNGQQQLTADENRPGYFYWQLPEAYADQISPETPLKFKLNASGYAYTVSRSGCLDSDNRWDNASDGCFATSAYQPYIGPYLTLISPDLSDNNETVQVLDPATSMVVNYETSSAHQNWTAKVQYRALGDSGWAEASETMTGRTIHHIEITGLNPDTSYEYRVLAPDNSAGKIYHFETSPTHLDDSHFLAIGDMQDPGDAQQRWQDVSNAIVANHLDEFRFIITVGDMAKDDVAHNGERYYFWKVFFDKGQELFARKPIMATPGNHDTPDNLSNAEGMESYRKYFNLPTDMAFADYYHFDYGNAHFMSVNSEIPVYYGRHPERDTEQRVTKQRAWLETQLNRPQQSTWNFAYWHVPAINPVGGKSEVKYMRPLTDLFHTKLDWAITGHVHENQRVKPTIATEHSFNQVPDYGRLSQQGVGYFVCPPAGQWPRNNATSAMHQLAFYPQHNGEVAYEIGYTIFQTTGEKLEITTYGMGDVNNRNPSGYSDNGSVRVIDQVSYSKTLPPENLAHNFTTADFRGTANNWQRTPFTLIADHTWQIEIEVTAADSQFKFYFDGDWHGDNQPDGIALTNESSEIEIAQGIGGYRITINELDFSYTVVKL